MSKITLLQVPRLKEIKKWNSLTLQENLIRCYNKNLFVDAELMVQGKIFWAHRCILCFHSPVLKKAFYSAKIPATTCTIKEIKPGGFEVLLRYLYTSEISSKVKADDLVEACYAAQILQMMETGEKLIQHVLHGPSSGWVSRKTIAVVQFWSLLEKCRSERYESFQEKLLKFAESNFKSVFDSEGFVKADIKIIKLVFDRKFPSVPQRYVMERIACWVEANDHLMSLDQHIRELLKCVDFKRLSPKEFYAVASKHDRLLSKKDSLDILMHIVDPTVCTFPEWCQTDDKRGNILANQDYLSKTDKFKSMDDIRGNQRSDEWRNRPEADFQSQEDLRKTAKVKNSEKRERRKSVAPACGKTLQESFYEMLEEGLFTDVTLIAKDKTGIPAHSLVLALGSEFFEDVFCNEVPAPKTFQMEETAEDVKDMLRYFYGCGTRSVFGPSLDCILRKTDMALKYMCYPLVTDCNDAILRTTLDPVNFWTLTGWVDRVSYSKIDSAGLMRYAATSTKEIFEHESFLMASKDFLVRVLKSDYLNMAEGDILEHVARWMEKNAKQLPTEISKKELLENIRFESLDSEQFFAFLKKHEGLVPIRDSFAVLEFLFRRSEEICLPAWCYRGPHRSVLYDPLMKIGTNVPVLWSGSPEKGKNRFFCSYTVTIGDKRPMSEIQFLELSLNFKSRSLNCTPDCSCSVSIDSDAFGSPKTFQDLKMSHQQRYLLPVYFRLDASCNRSFKLLITVSAKHCHKFYSIIRPRRAPSSQTLEFDNVTFLQTLGGMNCLCDAIVDGFTSENVPIPPHVLSENKNEAVTTEKCFKVAPESLLKAVK